MASSLGSGGDGGGGGRRGGDGGDGGGSGGDGGCHGLVAERARAVMYRSCAALPPAFARSVARAEAAQATEAKSRLIAQIRA